MSETMELFDSLVQRDVALWGEGSSLRFRASRGIMTEAIRSQLTSQKDLVLAAWRERAAKTIVSHPASYGQRALWFLNQSNPESGAYNVLFSARIRSEIDVPALHRAFQALVDRHPSLRTSYCQESGLLVQRVHGFMPISFAVHDRTGIDLEKLREEARACSVIPFDLQNGPLIRANLYSRAVDDHVLLLTVHHIAADGWSLFLLLDDLRKVYPAELEGGAPPPPRPTRDVLDHSRWQEKMLSGPEGRAHETYWLSKLAGALPLLSLPTDRPRQVSSSSQGASIPIDLGAPLSDALRKLAAREGTTPFVVLLTAYQVLLHRYSGQEEVIVGTPSYGRDRAEFGNVVGDFINMMPLRAAFGDDPPFLEILARIRKAVVEGIQHQDYPFSLLVEKLQPERNFSRTPVFQTVFILQKFKEVAGLENLISHTKSAEQADFAGLLLEPFPIPQQEGQFELVLELVENGGVFEGVVKYETGLFDVSTMREFASHYKTLLGAIVSSPEACISRLRLMTTEEREALVVGMNATDQEYPREQTVLDLIREQVARRPFAKAVRFETTELTYAELDIRSTRLARHLQSLGVGAGSLVAVCVERGLEMVIGLLAILKAGGAYVPLDPALPAERLRYIVEDSEAKVLVTQRQISEASCSGLEVVRVCLDDSENEIDRQSTEPLAPVVGPFDRAYVIYTSGSTGRPKGVETDHRALTNFLCSMAREPGLRETDVLMAVTTPAFDIAGLELFLPLITGGRIEVASRQTLQDGVTLARSLSDSGATVMQATPSTWRMLFESGWKGDRRLKVLCGGEAMDKDLAAQLVATCGSVWNMYGPTETTIWSSIDRIKSKEVTIGRPIANTRMYVLDSHGEPVPRGVVGELWIGGEGVARGYLNRPELTVERFVLDPFHNQGRMYRTGDLARQLPDGRLECLGRIDNQVKIRGYRIELEEIEAALYTHKAIRQCVVAARKEHERDVRLVAYVVLDDAQCPAVEELRSHLKTILPDYMIPSAFAFLGAIPLTENGKVDRKALPGPEVDLLTQVAGYVAPRNRVEQVMAQIWSDLLGTKDVGVFDHFFELGGHSLSATRLIARLKSAFGIELPLSSVFVEPTIAEMSKHIVYDDVTQRYYYEGKIHRWNRLIPAQPKGSRTPLFMVIGYGDADASLRVLSTIIPYLGLDQPVYGFQARWQGSHLEGYSSVGEAAQDFLAELRAVQPEGPYQLWGECLGGVIALEMAQELISQGEEVRLLVMSDTYRPTILRSLALDFVNRWEGAKYIISLIGQIIGGTQPSRKRLVQDVVRRKLGDDESKTREELNLQFRTEFVRTIYRHRPKKYPGRISLIVNEKQYNRDRSMGWDGVAASGLEIQSTPGDHLTRCDPYAAEFAKRLLDCIDRSSRSTPR